MTTMMPRCLERFKRQYFQLLELSELDWPSEDDVRPIDRQAWLYDNMFDSDKSPYLPPERYRMRVLKQLLGVIERANQDPDEDVGINTTSRTICLQ